MAGGSAPLPDRYSSTLWWILRLRCWRSRGASIIGFLAAWLKVKNRPMSGDNALKRAVAPPVLESYRAEGEITESDDAGAKHQQPKQAIFKNAGKAWNTYRCAHRNCGAPSLDAS